MSAAAGLLESGVGIHEVREWLGHRDISTTGNYLAVTGASSSER